MAPCSKWLVIIAVRGLPSRAASEALGRPEVLGHGQGGRAAEVHHIGPATGTCYHVCSR